MKKSNVYSIPALKRLPAYLRELKRLQAEGQLRVASPALARALHIDTIIARKDMEMLGVVGSPGVGFRVEELIDGIETFLGWKNSSEAFLVGTGDFGRALLGYSGFAAYGSVFLDGADMRSRSRGDVARRMAILMTARMDPELMTCRDVVSTGRYPYTGRLGIHIGILCVPDDDAQKIAELMVDSGILAIWNFTAHTLQLPEHIIRQRVNLGGDLAVLSVKLAEKLRERKENP